MGWYGLVVPDSVLDHTGPIHAGMVRVGAAVGGDASGTTAATLPFAHEALEDGGAGVGVGLTGCQRHAERSYDASCVYTRDGLPGRRPPGQRVASCGAR